MRVPATCVIAATMAVPFAGAYGQTLKQALDSQFTLTKFSQDKTDVVTAGSVLVLQKDGLMMYSTASPMNSIGLVSL